MGQGNTGGEIKSDMHQAWPYEINSTLKSIGRGIQNLVAPASMFGREMVRHEGLPERETLYIGTELIVGPLIGLAGLLLINHYEPIIASRMPEGVQKFAPFYTELAVATCWVANGAYKARHVADTLHNKMRS